MGGGDAVYCRRRAKRDPDRNVGALMITPEGLDRWRILPRLLMITMLVMTYRVVEWFMDIPADQVSIPQSALVSVMTGALTGAFGLYLGNDKSKND